ncbi:CaiB/BaiF CoA transferase family protein [Aridibaculum aurantiacum]|uniref:CaiB/BaiF CoA transferase family protein n=1 Tax=Aridibaculum aurantiacum TaxID=2810307 RepID=UPI001A96B96D|nr:CaiB/BaiF CoA-transferase family protein [Aridibaculum aurantiacum]
MNKLPLDGLVVLDFSQYLSGPSAALRLADLGARVIKVERPKVGDAGRNLAIKNLWVDDSSLLFHTINRNKESFAANLKDADDLILIKKLIKKADVMIHNFRPGVMEKVGLGYEDVEAINPRIVYGEITGYGKQGPWKNRPGQDLLLQSLTGLAYTSGNDYHDPVPFGLAIADSLCGAQLVQGILGSLIRRAKTGKGALIELSLMESLLDFQFELLTTYHTSGRLPKRSGINNGHPLLSAPYGIYKTTDGYIAVAMASLDVLATAINCEALKAFSQEEAFCKRDEIKMIISHCLRNDSSAYWLEKLHAQNLWAMEVLDWKRLTEHEAYRCLQMEQTLNAANGKKIITTRCPIRFNGERIFSDRPAPQLGEDNEKIMNEILNHTQDEAIAGYCSR